jgi:hypothetical protein
MRDIRQADPALAGRFGSHTLIHAGINALPRLRFVEGICAAVGVHDLTE